MAKKKKIRFDVITGLPGLIECYFNGGMMKKALDKKYIEVKVHDLRKYPVNKYGAIDDTPYGGGAGMILRIEPIYKTLGRLRLIAAADKKKKKARVIGLSAAGKRVTQRELERLASYNQLVFVCGRYEGYDERVTEFLDEELSIGDFVLTGGELPAVTIIDGVTRLIPGVLGNVESAVEESHSVEGQLEYPQYTKPETFEYKKGTTKKSLSVPDVLLSGHHGKIKKWREENRKKRP